MKKRTEKLFIAGFAVLAGTTMFAGKILEFNVDANKKINISNGSAKTFQYTNAKVAAAKNCIDVKLPKGSSRGHVGGVDITPSSPANSWAAMYKDGKLNGAVSLFLSTSRGLDAKTKPNTIRCLDHNNRNNNGLRTVLMSINNQLAVEVISKKDGLIFSNGKKSQHLMFRGKTPMKANTAYHVVVTFQTASDGTVTGKLYCKEGYGAIVPDKNKAIAYYKFKLNPAVVKNGFTSGVFRYGKMSNDGAAPLEQRFSRLTLYDSVPKEFPALNAKFAEAMEASTGKK